MVARIPILDVDPVIAAGRYPAKAVVGEPFTVSATVVRDGHDQLGAGVVLFDPDGAAQPLTAMKPTAELDRYAATVWADREGSWAFRIESWSDPYATWRHDAEIKIAADVDVELMLTEGALLLARAGRRMRRATADDKQLLRDAVTALRDTSRPVPARLATATSDDVCDVFARNPLRDLLSRSAKYPFFVDRERALYGAWYEFFPRSEGARVDKDGVVHGGTLHTAAKRLDAIAEMGFDVVYLPPVHPIGRINRKGPNNTLVAGPHDPGSPWAIGSADGGHDAVHPDLGTIDDFDAFVRRAEEVGLEVGLDLALQCAPDHPWAAEHPEWFNRRADGSIAYAENPPKKYQDIYPLNFDNDFEGLYAEVLRVVRHWMAHGVRLFRVDNPHTKPVMFWERLLAEIRTTDPDVVFLSEAFTRPAMMRALAMVGFHQSYTYFTWRNTRWELETYLQELAHETSHMLRPNLFVNTPDILTEYLQYGGPAAFKIRATIAALAGPSWGMYSGFELYEHVAARPGSEEYLDSEKYQVRIRDWDDAADWSLAPYLTRLNELRRDHPALRLLRNLTVHGSDNDQVMCWSKRHVAPDGAEDLLIIVINLDPHAAQETTVHLNMPALGLDWHEVASVHDVLTDETWQWGQHNYVRLDPAHEPAHILTVRKTAR
ncbi:MAG TPA: alpha-1,4-glucan--maltose-1-phosphate maltosyltransferase [Nocardioidaceae bacterium]|nr:alpha-1,4-glucan--maltose-1-phosphate maltosyltransferase [Nocardioidaceae bacterium]